MDQRPIKIDPDEYIPSQHLQMQFNECHRCTEQNAQIQALQIENAHLKQMSTGQMQALQIENGNLKRICTEQSQMIERLKSELAKFQCKPEEFEHFIAMPLSPIIPASMTPEPEKCFICLAEYMTNDDQKHICSGENEVGCEYCDQFFTSTLDLIDHLNSYHNEKSFYYCTKCPEMFSMALLLQFHEMSHPIADPIHICNICAEHFFTKEEMDEHHDKYHKHPRQTKYSKKQPASKPALPQSFLTLSASNNFKIDKPITRPRTKPVKRAKTAKLKPFKCAKCSECFTTGKKIQVHMKRVHTKSKARSFECYICKEKCKSLHRTQIHLRQHIRAEKCAVCQELYTKTKLDDEHICSGLKSMNCAYCQQTFTTTKSLLQHLQECKSEKFSYECGKCRKFFLMEFLADLHRKNHKETEPPKTYYCSTCSSSYGSIRDLLIHNKEHTETRTFLCDECGKGFLCAENLRHHKRTHNKKPIKCPHCDTISLGRPAHKRHLLRHQNIKFVCNICDLQLSNTQKLTIHKKIHTRTEADRVFGCTVCDKKFFTSKSSRSHFLKAHTTNRFECDLCDQSYKYKGDLNKHKRAVHGSGYLYGCPHCGKRFPQSYELDHHLFEHATVSEAEQPLTA